MTSRQLAVIASFSLILASLVAPDSAGAQILSRDDFSAYQFYIQPGPGNFFLTDSGITGPDLIPTFGATLGYAHNPYAADDLNWYIDCERGTSTPEICGTVPDPTVETNLLGPLLTLQLYGAIAFGERIQLGLNLPIFLYADGERFDYIEGTGRDITTRQAAPGGTVGALGDPRISVKARLVDPDEDGNGVIIAVAAWLNLPLGQYIAPGHFLGDRAPSIGGYVVAGMQYDGFRLSLNVGGSFREEQENIRSVIGASFNWALAIAYRVHPMFDIMVEGNGWTSFGQQFDSEAPTEIRAGGAIHLGEFAITFGGGAGLVYGVGLPVAHGFLGGSFTPRVEGDEDGDLINDADDGCPGDAEDLDGFEDEDGCPEDDNDADGIPDSDDPCPDEAEDVDEHEDEDGCPDTDNDGDGISDGYDSCPNAAEDMDGDRDTDGCPDTDADQDGIEGEDDQCPDEAEDFDGFADEDGCPEADVDGDGVPDETDECPEQAEDRDGYRDGDGCPEEGSGRGRRRRGR